MALIPGHKRLAAGGILLALLAAAFLASNAHAVNPPEGSNAVVIIHGPTNVCINATNSYSFSHNEWPGWENQYFTWIWAISNHTNDYADQNPIDLSWNSTGMKNIWVEHTTRYHENHEASYVESGSTDIYVLKVDIEQTNVLHCIASTNDVTFSLTEDSYTGTGTVYWTGGPTNEFLGEGDPLTFTVPTNWPSGHHTITARSTILTNCYDNATLTTYRLKLLVNNTESIQDDYIVQRKPEEMGPREPVNEPHGALDNHIPMRIELEGPEGLSFNVTLSATGGGMVSFTKEDGSELDNGLEVGVGSPATVRLYGESPSSELRDVVIKASTDLCQGDTCGTGSVTVVWVDETTFRGSNVDGEDFTPTSEAQLNGQYPTKVGITSIYDTEQNSLCTGIRFQCEISFKIKPNGILPHLTWSLARERFMAAWRDGEQYHCDMGEEWAPDGTRDHGWDGHLVQNQNELRLFAVDRPGHAFFPLSLERVTIKGKFREWAEVQVGNNWYVASDYIEWHTIQNVMNSGSETGWVLDVNRT